MKMIKTYKWKIHRDKTYHIKKPPMYFLSTFQNASRIVLSRTISDLLFKIYQKRIGILALLIEPLLLAAVYFFLSLVLFSSSANNVLFFQIFAALLVFRGFQKPTENISMSLSASSDQIRLGTITLNVNFISTWLTETILAQIQVMSFYIILVALNFPVSKDYLIIMLLTFVASLIAYPVGQMLAIITFRFRVAQLFFLQLISILWYLTPAIYPIEKVSSQFLDIYMKNPLAILITKSQEIINGDFVFWKSIKIIILLSGSAILLSLLLNIYSSKVKWIRKFL